MGQGQKGQGQKGKALTKGQKGKGKNTGQAGKRQQKCSRKGAQKGGRQGKGWIFPAEELSCMVPCGAHAFEVDDVALGVLADVKQACPAASDLSGPPADPVDLPTCASEAPAAEPPFDSGICVDGPTLFMFAARTL